VGGSGRPKHLKKCMKLNWNFRGGGLDICGKFNNKFSRKPNKIIE